MRWICFLCCVAALAQSDRGTIRGRVLDQGYGVGAAPVEAKSILDGTVYRATSSGSGEYSVVTLPPGDYEVTIAVEGFQKTKVTVRAAQAATADFVFQPDFQLGTLGDGDVYSRISQYHKTQPPEGVTPRTAAGKPDFSGVWRAPKTIRSDEPELLPQAQKALQDRFANNNADSPAARCMPDAVLRLSPFSKSSTRPA